MYGFMGSLQDVGVIVGEMSAQVPIGTQVRVKAFLGGYVATSSVIEVWVSNNSYGSWVQVLSETVPQVPASTYTFKAPTEVFDT